MEPNFATIILALAIGCFGFAFGMIYVIKSYHKESEEE